ncbi:gamma-glutamyl hydrolase A-like [Drosophila tropicalis]|uniref:gamma-glutamyl hydrolase A-like n=1 Tax=Drosophila tropicalis TaxID=46794 RepID=UPI0035ABD5E2
MEQTEAPCIGIMCIDLATELASHFGKQWHSFIASSYVKHLEAAGALVVPIWIGRDRSYYEHMMNQLNGILLPGGAVFINNEDLIRNPDLTNECVQSAYHIFDVAEEMNRAGKYFPLWGTCLGFQLMIIRAAKSIKVRTDCENIRRTLPVQLTKDFRQSQMLQQLPQYLADEMGRSSFACHNHKYCITNNELDHFKLSNDWHVLATHSDANGKEFINLIEHRQWPMFGCQFHPERAAFEQLYASLDNWKFSHTRASIELAQSFGHIFVDACRRSISRFSSPDHKSQHLIWNWQPVFSGHLKESKFLQCYLFEKNVDYPELIVR